MVPPPFPPQQDMQTLCSPRHARMHASLVHTCKRHSGVCFMNLQCSLRGLWFPCSMCVQFALWSICFTHSAYKEWVYTWGNHDLCIHTDQGQSSTAVLISCTYPPHRYGLLQYVPSFTHWTSPTPFSKWKQEYRPTSLFIHVLLDKKHVLPHKCWNVISMYVSYL